jgi:ParB/RepB/Spo0J family partition protein
MAGLEELAESIREHGVIEPIIVRPVGERYEIVAGERRYRASLIAELKQIPARVMELDDTQAAIFTALENLQREDLDIEDEGRQFAYLQQLTGLSQRKLAQKLGVDRQYISRRIRLLKRPDLLQDYRSGQKTLHQVLSVVGSEPADADADVDEVDGDVAGVAGVGDASEAAESGSAGPTDASADHEGGIDATGAGGIELVEREDLAGYLVARRPLNSSASTTSATSTTPAYSGGSTRRGGTRFRWRPLQQFYTWVGRTRVTDIPVDERATMRVQLTEIKDALEKQLAELDRLSESEEVQTPEQNELLAD